MNEEIIANLGRQQQWLIAHDAGSKEIIIIALLLTLALFVVLLAKKYRLPIVVGYVFLGMLLSTDVIGLLPFLSPVQKQWYEFTLSNLDYITRLTLGFIAFTIGSELSINLFKRLGWGIALIVLFEATGGFILVTLALLIIGQPLYLALILGGIASATAPAATVMVLKEYRAKGPLTSTIMAIVGIDDALALIIFSLIHPLALILYAGSGDFAAANIIIAPMIEVLGSIGLGLGLGYISQKYIVNFEDKTKKILTLITTIVGASAISIAFALSPLITNMAVGFGYRNFARKNPGIEEFLDTLTIPLYALFFILAGTEIRFSNMNTIGFFLIAFTYLLARIIGKVGGASLAAWMADVPESIKKYAGLGLFPQSGVALALAYSVQKSFSAEPEIGLMVFNTLLLTAALTEIFGPLATKYAVQQAGEIEKQ